VRTNCLILTIAAALAFGGFGLALGQDYGPPYECYEYYYCLTTLTCYPSSGSCSGGTYNYISQIPQYVGFCISAGGEGCSTVANALCYNIEEYNVPAGQTCNAATLVCFYWTNAEGCD
jgi:hypothetical protein